MSTQLERKIHRYVKTDLFPHQYRGIRFLEKTGGRTLILDDMGVGKSVQSGAYAAIHPEKRPVIVVTLATLKFHWQREFKTHFGLRVHICNGRLATKEELYLSFKKSITKLRRKARRQHWTGMRLIRTIRTVRQSYKTKVRENHRKRRDVKTAQILIVNYDILMSWLPVLEGLNPQILIIDETHKTKNKQAKRTKACIALSKGVPHVIGLSGTPISGGPADFFPILHMVRPKEFRSWWVYGMEYCNPKRNPFGGGWDFSGSSNLGELRRRIRPFTIRRLKHKVLKDLPTKTRTVIPVEITNRKTYAHAEENFLSWLLRSKGKRAYERARRAEAIVRIGQLKILAAKGKLKQAVEWVRDFLEGSDQKLIVFGIHKVIISKLKKAFPSAALIDGSVSAKEVWKTHKGKKYLTSKRQEQVDRFQEDPKCRLLLGQMTAAGNGLNLTAGSNVLFVELGWTPGEHDQAEDRALRIGQTRNVSVYYLVGHKTIEERILNIIQAKDEVVAEVLDGKKGGVMKLLASFLRSAKRHGP